MDKVALQGIEVFAHHGVHPAERELGQRFVIDVVLMVDAEAAVASDALGRTVDYADVHGRVVDVASSCRCQLIETLAGRICRALLDAGVAESVTVKVRKPNPPIAGFRGTAEVEITRSRDWKLQPGGEG